MRFENISIKNVIRTNSSYDTIFIELVLSLVHFCQYQYENPSLNLKTAYPSGSRFPGTSALLLRTASRDAGIAKGILPVGLNFPESTSSKASVVVPKVARIVFAFPLSISLIIPGTSNANLFDSPFCRIISISSFDFHKIFARIEFHILPDNSGIIISIHFPNLLTIYEKFC